jgi:hypothetical protein
VWEGWYYTEELKMAEKDYKYKIQVKYGYT